MTAQKRARLALVGIFGCVAGASLVLGVLGQFGRICPPLDSINNFSQLWLLAGVLAGTGLVAISVRGRTAGFVVVAAMWALAFSNLGPLSLTETDDTLPPEVRLVQFNALKGNHDPEAAAAWILLQKPDIVVLEEGALAGARVRDLLRPKLPFVIDCLGDQGGRCSTMILSSKRPLDSGGLADGDPENRGALSAVWARFQGPRATFTVVGVHMVRPWPYGDQAKDLGHLAGFIRDLHSPHTIVAGDFNQTPWTFQQRAFRKTIGLTLISGGLPTWPASPIPVLGLPMTPLLAIDHVYAGHAWTVTAVKRGPVLGSDHLPVAVSLRSSSPSRPPEN